MRDWPGPTGREPPGLPSARTVTGHEPARRRTWECALAIVFLSVIACGPSSTPASPTASAEITAAPGATLAATELPEPAPSIDTTVPASPTAGGSQSFQVAVIADTASEPVTRDQAQAVVQEAGKFLRELTPFDIEMTDFVAEAGGTTNDMASRYITSHPGSLPNGIVIFSFGDGNQARLYGGYSYALAGPPGFRNSFVSPVTGAGQIYVAVVQLGHKYAACGYGGTEAVQSTHSLDGECRNQPGTACVQQNGYSMCSNAVGTLYMSTPTYFAASTIIHELLHPFAPGGDKDHYGTPDCSARMGYPAGFYDLQESQYHNDLCPDVYATFSKSHVP